MPTNYTRAAATGVFGSDDELTDLYTTEKFPLGSYREEDGKGYRFVKLDAGATAAAVGNLAYFTTTAWNVTATAANTASGCEAGVFISVIAASGYGWIQTWGVVTVATSGVDDIAKGDGLIGAGSAAGSVRRVPVPGGNAAADIQTTALLAAQTFAVALADDDNSANTVSAFIQLE